MYSPAILLSLVLALLAAFGAFLREQKQHPVLTALPLGIVIGLLTMWCIAYIFSPQPASPTPTLIPSPQPSPLPTEVLERTWIEEGQAAPFLDSRALIKCHRISYYGAGDASNFADLVASGTGLHRTFDYFRTGEQEEFTVSGTTYVISLLAIEANRVQVAIAESGETGDS